jgi:DNA (cytosine-5)-methyltransferase 1
MRGAPFDCYEFFAGGGMAAVGLGPAWRCRFANDFDPAKARTYRANHPDHPFREGDVWSLSAADLPGRADLAWASSPCQDLSLAGARRGLAGGRSSAFWGFWRLMEALAAEGRSPRSIVVENVLGLLTSHGGKDLEALCAALAGLGYRFGALEIDASLWLPQSRPRLFVVATLAEGPLGAPGPAGPFHGPGVRQAFARLPQALQDRWVWWSLSATARRNADLAAVLEPDDQVRWFETERTERLLGLMAPLHRAKLDAALASGGRAVGAVFRRIRSEHGRRAQRAEVRFDGLAGCLRTPAGGSSRQALLVVEHGTVRGRLVTPREAARLMGLPDAYLLPKAETAALKVMGDGVAVPVVRALAEQLLEPLLSGSAAAAA